MVFLIYCCPSSAELHCYCSLLPAALVSLRAATADTLAVPHPLKFLWCSHCLSCPAGCNKPCLCSLLGHWHLLRLPWHRKILSPIVVCCSTKWALKFKTKTRERLSPFQILLIYHLKNYQCKSSEFLQPSLFPYTYPDSWADQVTATTLQNSQASYYYYYALFQRLTLFLVLLLVPLSCNLGSVVKASIQILFTSLAYIQPITELQQ